MNEWLKNMMGKLKDLWSKWKPIQKVIIIGIVLVVIVVIIASARLSSAPTTVRLFNAPVTDQAALTNILDRIYKYQIAYNECLYDLFNAGLLPVYSAGFIDLKKQYLTVGINGLSDLALIA